MTKMFKHTRTFINTLCTTATTTTAFTTPLIKTTTTAYKPTEERLQHLEELSKIHTLRSCHEYDEYGINTSGRYFIDPDGPLIGLEPFEVYCNFEGKLLRILSPKIILCSRFWTSIKILSPKIWIFFGLENL